MMKDKPIKAWSIFIYTAGTVQECSDPSHIMGPLIRETGSIKRLVA